MRTRFLDTSNRLDSPEKDRAKALLSLCVSSCEKPVDKLLHTHHEQQDKHCYAMITNLKFSSLPCKSHSLRLYVHRAMYRNKNIKAMYIKPSHFSTCSSRYLDAQEHKLTH